MQGLSEQIKEHPRSSLGFKHNAQQNFAVWHRAEERKKVIRNVIVIVISLVVAGTAWYFKDSMYCSRTQTANDYLNVKTG